MPRNEYGPEDPEVFAVGGELRDVDGPLLAYQRPADGRLSSCACGAPAVTMRVDTSDARRVGEGKTPLRPVCAECSRREGEAEKKEILARHSTRRKKILEWLHVEMKDLYDEREARDPSTAWVTVVDARRAYRRAPDTDPNADLRFLGSLFRARGWEKIPGKTAKNTDEGNHARPVDCWRYVGGEK